MVHIPEVLGGDEWHGGVHYSLVVCPASIEGKRHQMFNWKHPVKGAGYPLALVHSDQCGPLCTPLIAWPRNFALFVNGHSPGDLGPPSMGQGFVLVIRGSWRQVLFLLAYVGVLGLHGNCARTVSVSKLKARKAGALADPPPGAAGWCWRSWTNGTNGSVGSVGSGMRTKRFQITNRESPLLNMTNSN